MNPIIQTPACAGELVEVEVPGAFDARPNPENEVEAAAGTARTMYAYVPASGCPHPKQTQVLFVYRDGRDRASANSLLESLGLKELAESAHAIVVFPNPTVAGWSAEDTGDDDANYVVRCFAALKGGCGVAAFNGMMFHLACTPAASAFVWAFALTRPLDAAAVMLGSFPAASSPPTGTGAPQAAWLYEGNEVALAYLERVNGPVGELPAPVGDFDALRCFMCVDNPALRFFESAAGLTADEISRAWDLMFARTRRWRNDIFGTYQERVDFERRGFTPHVASTELGLADGLPRTWFEYVPPQLSGTEEPVPLVIYFHGINCTGLYGAEQSGWADIAEREDFMCAFPDATVGMRWNGWADDRLPSDIDYVMALIEHMAEVHPLDRTRIYLSGFSMGSMFTNVLAAAYPEVFAGAVAVNGPMAPYFQTLDEALPGTMQMQPGAAELRAIEPRSEDLSPIRAIVDAKRAEGAPGVPFVQFVGLQDSVGFEPGCVWPVRFAEDGQWEPTISFWLRENGLAPAAELDAGTETGIASPTTCVEGGDGRFIHQAWDAADARSPYHFIAVKRMPHAVDLRELVMGWDIVKHFSRVPNKNA